MNKKAIIPALAFSALAAASIPIGHGIKPMDCLGLNSNCNCDGSGDVCCSHLCSCANSNSVTGTCKVLS